MLSVVIIAVYLDASKSRGVYILLNGTVLKTNKDGVTGFKKFKNSPNDAITVS